ncbi:MAG: YihY/virulence factor BrkB family protein [Gemmatimonadetes bacterium]|nr:YihY/virulence factor BrkB family protein [Gemmatimonadota bacterium]
MQRTSSRTTRHDAPGSGSGEELQRSRREESLPKQLWRNVREDDVLNQAAGLAYFAFLSLPPAFLVLFALTGFFGGAETAEWITLQLTALLPDETATLVDGFVQNVVYEQAPGPFSIGLLLAIWAASNVFMAISRALNTAYQIEDPRPWVKQRAIAAGVMFLFIVLFLSGSAVLIAGPQIADALDLYGVAGAAWTVAQWILPVALIVAAIWMAYYFLPARDQKRSNREILIGAAAAAAVWLAASIAFRFYIANFGNYNETYGFVGAVIVLLLWLYITGFVILMGGELAAELEARARN